MPTLTVQRDKGRADSLRKYRILVDGKEVGKIGEGEILRQQIIPGRHVIEAKIDWCGSQPLQFTAKSKDRVVLVRSQLRGWNLLIALFTIIFNRRGYLKLELIR